MPSAACSVLLLCGLLVSVSAFIGAPIVPHSKGEPWPAPQTRENYDGYLIVRPSIFQFTVSENNCDLLESALRRYFLLISDSTKRSRNTGNYKSWKKDKAFDGYLDTLDIRLMAECEDMPSPDMEEMYELRIDTPDLPGEGYLTSQTVWGIMRGLETFVQLLTVADDGVALQINATSIMDFPRFSHRGLMIDTSRHFLPMHTILETLDAMEINKLNVLHWHIVDDQSFPYESARYPALCELGSFHYPTYVYTRDDMREVIEYGRQRGIRVLVEFDTPGHTTSWGPGQEGLLTVCYSGEEPDGRLGPIDPSKNSNYDFLQGFFEEAVELFPDQYIHLGGDEVPFDCWESNPGITDFMQANNITDYSMLEDYYIHNLLRIVEGFNSSYIVWQEVFDNNVSLQDDTVVHVWKGDHQVELNTVTAGGFRTLLSSCWYLDYLESGGDWIKFYQCDPQDFDGTEEQKNLIMGGEACMWGEVVDSTNIHQRVWPRASATAEKLWSAANATTDSNLAVPRLEEHRCRMVKRGIPAQPASGPGYCPEVFF